MSAWLARRGARPVGIDVTPEQLATARALQAEHGLRLPAHRGQRRGGAAARRLVRPRDLRVRRQPVVRSRGVDPRGGAPPATRRPAVVPHQHAAGACSRCTTRTSPPARRSRARSSACAAFEWSDGSVEFHLPHGELIALLGRCGFTVEALHELQAPEGASSRYEYVTPEWARRWPSEEIWVARLGESRIGRRLTAARRGRRTGRRARGAGSRRRRGPRPLAPGPGRQRAAVLLPGPHARGRRGVVLRRHHRRPLSHRSRPAPERGQPRRAAPATSPRRASTTSATRPGTRARAGACCCRWSATSPASPTAATPAGAARSASPIRPR